MSHFHYYTKQELLDQVKLRKYETKLGEQLKVLELGKDSLALHTDAKYVCFGIPENIGILGDHGTRGVESTWFHFVNSFLNLQSSDLCSGDEIILAGYFDFSPVMNIIESNFSNSEERINACRHGVCRTRYVDCRIERRRRGAGEIS
jgi:formiminoglutamase